MNHIAKLTLERDEACAALREAIDRIIEIESYLLSPKFTWPDSDYVHVRTDILPKIGAVRFGMGGI